MLMPWSLIRSSLHPTPACPSLANFEKLRSVISITFDLVDEAKYCLVCATVLGSCKRAIFEDAGAPLVKATFDLDNHERHRQKGKKDHTIVAAKAIAFGGIDSLKSLGNCSDSL
jgi:threonine dehydratase